MAGEKGNRPTFRDVAVGIGPHQPYRIVAAVELVRGAGGDEPIVAGLLEPVMTSKYSRYATSYRAVATHS